MSTDDVGEQSIMTLGLRYSPASPFVRKVLVFAHETGLAERIEPVPTDVWAPDSNIFRDNPLGKVPALVSDDGTFIGSALCCDYLDTLHGGSRLIPAEPRERWPALQLHALADGIMEAAVARVAEELRRPKTMVFQGNIDRQAQKIRHAFDAIERIAAALGERVALATITLGCALGYLDFRLPLLAWCTEHPALAIWDSVFAARPAMKATKPFVA
jgi:glutathione S-transferase